MCDVRDGISSEIRELDCLPNTVGCYYVIKSARLCFPGDYPCQLKVGDSCRKVYSPDIGPHPRNVSSRFREGERELVLSNVVDNIHLLHHKDLYSFV